MIKRLIALILVAGTCHGADVLIGNIADGFTYSPDGAGNVLIGFGSAVSPLWTDTNSPALLYYLQDTQPNNYIADVSGNDYFMTGASVHPALFWCDDAYYFDGASSYMIETNMPMALGVCSNISFNCWMRADDTAASGRGMGYIGTFANSQGKFSAVAQASAFELRINGSTTENAGRIIAAGALEVGAWRMYTATYNGITLALYTNGVLAKTNSYSNIPDFTGLKNVIGGFYSASYTALGDLTQARWDKRTLSASDVLTLYTNGMDNTALGIIDDTDLMAFYPITNDALEVHDYTGNCVNLDPMPTFANAPTFGNTNGMPAGLKYVDFDGTDDYLLGLSGDVIAAIDAKTNPRTNDFTLCMWFWMDSYKSVSCFSGRKPVANAADGFGMWACNATDNYLKAQVGDGSASNIITADIQITTQAWHFAVMRRDYGTKLDMYYDGAWQAMTTNETYDINIPDSSEWTIGSDANGSYVMDGRMIEVRYYTNALSDSAIDDIYNYTGTNNAEARFTLP